MACPTEHPGTALSLNNLASVLRDQGDLVGARRLLERALVICEKALGPEHLQTATALNDLAYTLQDQGHLAEARLLYERALAICEKVFGSDHPVTASIGRNLAVLLASESAGASAPSERRLAIERLTSSGRDLVTREILAKMLASDSDSGIRCFIVEKLAELWPDQQTQDILIVVVENDDSADVRASCLELLSRIWWKNHKVRQFLRSQVDTANDPIRERLLHAVFNAGTRLSNFWEGKLFGARHVDEEPEMLPGYPAFRIAQFRLRDIGPIRDSGVVQLAREVNIFLGDNAAGKTTILRALGLATIGHAAANEVEDKPIAYLRKGAEVGTIEVLFELVSDPGALPEESGYFAVGLQIASGSSRFSPIPDSEMSLLRPGQSTRLLPNSAEALGALRSVWPSQFGFVCGYGAVRTFSESRFSIQPEAQNFSVRRVARQSRGIRQACSRGHVQYRGGADRQSSGHVDGRHARQPQMSASGRE
jgi:Tetratricopeptide repeat/AAA domain